MAKRSSARAALGLALLLTLLAVLAFLTVLASTGSADGDPASVIRVTGRARVTVAPDRAFITLGVVSEAPEAKVAASQNAEKLDSVLRALREVIGDDGKIETKSYALRPNYTYSKSDGERRITGYIASNVVEVRTSALDGVGRVIDRATAAGANDVRQLRFGLADEAPLEQEALARAARSGRAKAEAIAAALGLHIVRVVSIDEGGQPMRVVPMHAERMATASAGAQTPVEPGELEIGATLSLAFEVAQ